MWFHQGEKHASQLKDLKKIFVGWEMETIWTWGAVFIIWLVFYFDEEIIYNKLF